MPKIVVWKCPRTNKIFEKKKAYIKHLRKLARAHLDSRNEHKRYTDFLKSVETLMTTAVDVNEIIDWFQTNWLEVCYRCWYTERNSIYKGKEFDKYKIPKLLDLKMEVSETSDIRRGYELKSPDKVPGFIAKVELNTSTIVDGYCFSMDIFRALQKISVNYGNGGKTAVFGCTMKKSEWISLKGNHG